MRMLLLSLALLTNGAIGETVSCPDLSTAMQVGSCPSERELRYTFDGYCSSNEQIYKTDDTLCESYDAYRRAKNVALWESADGQFFGYMSCDLPQAQLRGARAESIQVTSKRGLTRLACSYGENVVFAHRTRAACTVEGDGECNDDAAACRAQCEPQ